MEATQYDRAFFSKLWAEVFVDEKIKKKDSMVAFSSEKMWGDVVPGARLLLVAQTCS